MPINRVSRPNDSAWIGWRVARRMRVDLRHLGNRVVIAGADDADRWGTWVGAASTSSGTTDPAKNCDRCSSWRRIPGANWTTTWTRDGYWWPFTVPRLWATCNWCRRPVPARSNSRTWPSNRTCAVRE